MSRTMAARPPAVEVDSPASSSPSMSPSSTSTSSGSSAMTAPGMGNAATMASLAESKVQDCPPLGSAELDSVRANVVMNAVMSLPSMDGAAPSIIQSVEDTVSSAATEAFNACFAVAVREEPQGECGSAGPSAEVVEDALRRYCAGPGIAVESFERILTETSVRCATEGEVTDVDVSEALMQYETTLRRSLLAYNIQTNPNIKLASVHSSSNRDNANASDNIQQVIEGEAVQRSDYLLAPGGTTQLSETVLTALNTLGAEFKFSISELAGASHSNKSRHYEGVAIDVNVINGQRVSSTNRSVKPFMDRCRALGATEMLGPGSIGHSTHVHAGWPRP